MPVPITAIVLTYNEALNIDTCLGSLHGWASEIIVVDSGSTDNTIALAQKYTNKIYSHEFINYSQQRNWAINELSIGQPWVMNIDADHELTTELKNEISDHFEKGIAPLICGFMASRRTMFMGRWIRHGGHYPVYHGIIFKKGKGYCEEKLYDQHFVIEGESLVLKGDVIDTITDSLSNFTERHNHWATLEAEDAMKMLSAGHKTIQADKNGNPMQQRRYQRLKYYSYPIFWRAILYFLYRYFIKMGFLDGRQGLVFHFLQCFWFRFLVDAKIYEAGLNKK
jgi:glycosyltransferase involved in cell wall biosynthesis